jgi:hypothetical protein
MENPELGYWGFYIYSFLKRNADVFGGVWKVSQVDFAFHLEISKTTLIKYLKELEFSKLISVVHMSYFKNTDHLTNEYRAI